MTFLLLVLALVCIVALYVLPWDEAGLSPIPITPIRDTQGSRERRHP